MCLSVPMQVVEWLDEAGDLATVERAGRQQQINMMLVGPQPVGTWVLVSLGMAKEVVEGEYLTQIEEALSALAASLEGDYRPEAYFQDLERS